SAAVRGPRPVGIVAAVIAIAIAVGVGSWQQVRTLRVARHYVRAIAEPSSPIKSQTLIFQRAALASGHMLPIYGSSELYCCGDPYRATQLFASEPTGFDAFAVGLIGTGDLFFAETFGALGNALRGKKVVILDSPLWFNDRQGIAPDWYVGTFS